MKKRQETTPGNEAPMVITPWGLVRLARQLAGACRRVVRRTPPRSD
jgi:hypothetical protein